MDLKEDDILGEDIQNHWYYVAKGQAMRAMIGGAPVDHVLDVGAGSGVFTRQLIDFGLANEGTCVDPGYEAERDETHGGATIHFVRGVETVPQKLILMMDVLEHVDDDVSLVRAYTDHIPDDARLLITVPAFQFLWSGHDEFLDHRRRYTIDMVRKTVETAGLKVVKDRYFFGGLFPVAAAMRVADRVRLSAKGGEAKSALKPAPSMLNKALVGLHALERRTLFPINRVAGLSVFCLAAKA